MLPSSLCRLWQPDRAANAAQDNRSYTTAWGTIHLFDGAEKAKTPARSKATGGGPFAKACFALGTRRAELILGLSARSPMPRGRQLGTARWCHAVHTLPLRACLKSPGRQSLTATDRFLNR